MKPIINPNKHPFIKWLKYNQKSILVWFIILLFLIIYNVVIWLIPVSVAERLFASGTVTIVDLFLACLS